MSKDIRRRKAIEDISFKCNSNNLNSLKPLFAINYLMSFIAIKGLNGPLIALCIFLFVIFSPIMASQKWPGVDETVVEKYAADHKRSAKDPIIKLEGDVELFAFLSAGAIGGFIGGYFFRILMEKRK